MRTEDISGGNLFMMCSRLEVSALTELPAEYIIRPCTPEELDIWKAMHFDDEAIASQYYSYMTEYFEQVYGSQRELFFRRCLFLCDNRNTPVGTCFVWKAYGAVTTIQWYKIRQEYEGRGLGRALLSYVMKTVSPSEYPVYLHTHPGCFRAIKLYTDFGFSLVTDEEVGYRTNDLQRALPYLKEVLSECAYQDLRFSAAPAAFLAAAKQTEYSQF